MRLILLVLVILFPFGILGLAIGKLMGLMVGLVLGITLFVYWGATAEHAVLSGLRTLKEASPGTRSSVLRVTHEELGVEAPAVYEVAEASPNALIARMGGRAGYLVLTQGLLAVLTESELRVVIRVLVMRLRSKLTPQQTFCASLAHRLLKIGPHGWTRFILVGDAPSALSNPELGPQAFFGFLLLYPCIRFIVWCGSSVEGLGGPTALSSEQSLLWHNAMRKVAGSTPSAHFSGNPGLLALYLSPPKPMTEALSLK